MIGLFIDDLLDLKQVADAVLPMCTFILNTNDKHNQSGSLEFDEVQQMTTELKTWQVRTTLAGCL